MYYVYVLQSRVDKNIYIGVTADLRKRLKEHNLGETKSTKGRKPFELIYYEAYKDKRDATKREYNLKTGQQREIIKERLKYSLTN
jgi:putative endonuclease